MATLQAPGFASRRVESSWPPPRVTSVAAVGQLHRCCQDPIPERKIPRDLTEASLSGVRLSIFAGLAMLFLFGTGVSPVTYGHKRYSVMRIEEINDHSVLLL